MTAGTPTPRRTAARWRTAAAAASLLVLALPGTAAGDVAPAETPEIVNVASRDFAGAPSIEVSYVPGWNSEAALYNGSSAFGGHGDVWGTYGEFDPEHWAQYTWDEPVTISSSRIWFWHDMPNPGNVRPPAAWVLEYRDLGTGEWAEVDAEAYPIATGTAPVQGPNEVTFAEVETDALRVVLSAQPNGTSYYSVASTEWEVWGYQYVAPEEPEDPDAPLMYEEVHARTLVGAQPQLPAQVWGMTDFGPLRYVDVDWDAVDTGSLAQPGQVTATGTVTAYEDEIEATVHVVESLDAALTGTGYASTVTTPGVAPVCPSTVLGTYADGSMSSTVPVQWDDVDAEEYAQAEAFFDIEGTVAGAASPALCTVFVLERIADGDGAPIVGITWLDAPAGSGWHTAYPRFEVTAEPEGADIDVVEYSLDGGQTWTAYTGPTTLQAEGQVELLARATDVADGVGEARSTARVDVTDPVTGIDWELGEDGTTAELTLSPDDGALGSGVARTLYSAGPDSNPENPDNLNDMWATYEGPFTIALRDVPTYVHIHSQDSAGLQETTQTVTLPAAAAGPVLDVTAEVAARCVVGRVVTTVKVTNGADVPVALSVATAWGTKDVPHLAPGRSGLHAFSTRAATVPAGDASVEVSAVVDGEDVTTMLDVPHEAFSCS